MFLLNEARREERPEVGDQREPDRPSRLLRLDLPDPLTEREGTDGCEDEDKQAGVERKELVGG